VLLLQKMLFKVTPISGLGKSGKSHVNRVMI